MGNYLKIQNRKKKFHTRERLFGLNYKSLCLCNGKWMNKMDSLIKKLQIVFRFFILIWQTGIFRCWILDGIGFKTNGLEQWNNGGGGGIKIVLKSNRSYLQLRIRVIHYLFYLRHSSKLFAFIVLMNSFQQCGI